MGDNSICNIDIRNALRENGIKYWEAAKEIGISSQTLTVWLRKELPADRKENILAAIGTIQRRRMGMESGEEGKRDVIEESCRALDEAIERMLSCIEDGNRVIREAQNTIDMAVRTSTGIKKYRDPKEGANNYKYEPLQNRLIKLVNESPYSQKEIADGLGIAQCTLTGWLHRDLGMTTESLVAVADYFGVSLDYLTGRKENPEEEIGPEDMKARMRESYEIYLKEIRGKQYMDKKPVYLAPWPYNLLDEIFHPYEKEPPEDIEDRVNKALESLAPREAQAILAYYKDEGTLEDVAKKFSVTRERIRQIIMKGVRKLRHPSRLKIIEYSDEELALKREIASEKAELEETLAELREKVQKLRAAGADVSVPGNVEEELNMNGVPVEEITLEDLEVSVRTFNCLKRANVNTVGDIEELIKAKGTFGLLRVRNLGRKSVDEIFFKLKYVTGRDWRKIAAEVDVKLEESETGC